MKRRFIASLAVIAALSVAPSLAQAQAGPADTPGHKMQTKGSVKGHPGASGYAPGHVMQQRGSRRGYPGASGYAPGRTTTGSSTR
jgi:hypothetical protein